jgi:hypothetical protein
MAERIYKRLPGRGFGAFTISSLWEADDHVLLVESNRITESYRRFFFRDIQAVVLCRTKTWLVWGSVLATIALVLGGVSLLQEERVLMGLAAGFAGLFAVLAAVQFLRGPTCRCTLRTAVQTQRLASLSLQPKIDAAQPREATTP